jgi:hypothetical protein
MTKKNEAISKFDHNNKSLSNFWIIIKYFKALLAEGPDNIG